MSDESRALEPFNHLLKASPYAKLLYAALKWNEVRKLKDFLRGLDGAAEELSATERDLFEKYVHSNEGASLLGEYADSVIRSRSPTARAALAILYADVHGCWYEHDFKGDASAALEGITERSIDAFLLIVDSQATLPRCDVEAFPVVVCRSALS